MSYGIMLLLFAALPLWLLSLEDDHKQRAVIAGILAILAILLDRVR